ncbi:hypothetical protein [Actinocorallia longicatena]|uniref:SCO0930 family lipoprotein n=1 Tax=Actinocorallia longicatena TaxID=111803 RepID=A0ABP6QIF2_9ACTN
MRIRPIWAFPLAAVATTGILFTANKVTGTGPGETTASPYTLADSGDKAAEDPDAGTTPAALSAQNDPTLGRIVVDGKGWTLYRFDKDTAKPPTSNCDGDCAKAWPPVPASDDVQLKGVAQKNVGTVTRADGTEQLTLGGWPLYRYAKDTNPGDTNGQGVGGVWFATAPDGKKAKAADPAPDPAETTEPSATPAPKPKKTQTTPNWAGWTVLKAVKDPKLGTIVQDGKGWTLYRFDKDVPKTGTSACNGACAKLWPPVKFTAKLKLTGVSKGIVGNIMRKDGICQLTLNGWPIYRYAKDVNPGDTNGQGVGGVWFATTPEGKKAAAKTTSNPEDEPQDGGYTY